MVDASFGWGDSPPTATGVNLKLERVRHVLLFPPYLYCQIYTTVQNNALMMAKHFIFYYTTVRPLELALVHGSGVQCASDVPV